MTDLLDHGGDVGIAGGLTREKARREALVGAIEIDPFEEDAMEMEIQIESTPESLDKCDRPRLDVGSRIASCDGFVHIILRLQVKPEATPPAGRAWPAPC
jgi:hypothetical protein